MMAVRSVMAPVRSKWMTTNRVLIAVKSCYGHRQAGYHDIIRKTWGQDVPPGVDLRFFIGYPDSNFESKHADDVCLGAPDEYIELPRKTKAILGWSVWNQYDFTFLCDNDTFLIPRLLLQSGFENYDYAGRFGAMPAIGTTWHYRDAHGDYPDCHPWASGGVGYFVSRKAAEILRVTAPSVWAEDMWVGQVLGPRIQSGEIRAADLQIECQSAWHFPRRSYNQHPYDPKFGWMEKMYAEHR